jgi:hypothetical protein
MSIDLAILQSFNNCVNNNAALSDNTGVFRCNFSEVRA